MLISAHEAKLIRTKKAQEAIVERTDSILEYICDKGFKEGVVIHISGGVSQEVYNELIEYGIALDAVYAELHLYQLSYP